MGSIKKRKRGRDRKRKMKKEISSFLISLGIVSGIFLLAIVPFYSLTRMDGYAMTPTLSNQELVVVKRGASVRRFDLICFRNPFNNKKIVSRVIGVPGDSFYYQDDLLVLNGEGKTERYLNQTKAKLVEGYLTEDFNLSELTGEGEVPEDTFFVLSDNRQHGFDSRDFGFVHRSTIVGKVEN